MANDDLLSEMGKALEKAREGFRLTREYVGEDTLPAIEGWAWYDADRDAEAALSRYNAAKKEVEHA